MYWHSVADSVEYNCQEGLTNEKKAVLTARRAEREETKMKKYSDWKLHNFINSIIKEEIDIDDSVYLDTDRIEVEIDGDTVIYYIPIEYSNTTADIRLMIYPDFTYRIELY